MGETLELVINIDEQDEIQHVSGTAAVPSRLSSGELASDSAAASASRTARRATLLVALPPPPHGPVWSVTPMISAASHHLRLAAMAFGPGAAGADGHRRALRDRATGNGAECPSLGNVL